MTIRYTASEVALPILISIIPFTLALITMLHEAVSYKGGFVAGIFFSGGIAMWCYSGYALAQLSKQANANANH